MKSTVKYLLMAALGLAAALTPQTVCAGNADLETGMVRWFGESLEGKNPAPFTPDKKLKAKDLGAMSALVWKAWQTANLRFDEERLPDLRPISDDSAKWVIPPSLEEDAVMAFRYGSKGERPEAGYPLFLYLHGSGERQREWANGLRFAQTFEDSPSVYFVPRIPRTGEWYRWWQKGKQFAWERLLRQSLAGGQIDPERIYFFGISEGGYGSQRLASFYADYLAAAGPMAGGEPLMNAPVENCRNIAFSLRTGDEDYGFYRDKLTRYTKAAFDTLEALSPGDYRHWIELIPGKGHSIDYRPTTPWMSKFTRNPWPKRVSWENFEMDGRKRTGFYNLAVDEPDTLTCRQRYEMTIHGNEIDLTVDRVAYVTTETDSRWGIALDFEKSYTPATAGTVTVYLNSHLVDLNRPVTLTVNGHTAFKGKLRLSLDCLMESCAEYFDPDRLFPAKITVDLATLR